MTTLLRNGIIINEGYSYSGSIYIENDRISKIIPSGTTPVADADKVIDCTNLYIIPGVIDDQVHFREPGSTHKGDIRSESAAAVLGGVTSYMDMPNNNPPAVNLEMLKIKNRIAAENSYANWSFYLGADNNNLDQILLVNPADVCGIKIFMGSSTGNMLVDNPETLEKIFSLSRVLIAVHCEEESIIRKNLRSAVGSFGDEIPFSMHPAIRSREACIASTRKAVGLAFKYNSRLHILHISTREELEMLREAGKINPGITGEVCVHYMLLDSRDYSSYGSLMKCNPAIKEVEDRLAIIEAVRDGIVKVVATDHAPHTKQEKDSNYLNAPSGLPLIQHSFQIMWDLHKSGCFNEFVVVDRMAHSPAINFKIKDRGFLREGYYADIMVFDPNKEDKTSTTAPAYKCGWSPFAGRIFSSSVIHTFVNGVQVVSEGKLTGLKGGQKLHFDND
jgi:dihydroorotase